ncbi:toxin glutamine deamidase domain-containing protein [Yoonia rosea]|nr:toxin glutamine deamidase domain-containing protein [Yoonia rosea]
MTTARFFLAHCLIWLLTLASPAGAGHLVVDLQEGIAQSVFAGLQEGAPERQPGQSDDDYAAVYNAWKNDVAGQANLLGAVVGYTTSGGQAVNVSNAASIAQSGALNNYLGHTELRQYRDALAECAPSDRACFDAVAERFEQISRDLDAEFAACETEQYRLYHLSRIEAAEQSGAFDDIMRLLSLQAVNFSDDFRVDLMALQYDRAETLDTALFTNLDEVGRAQLREEVTSSMCAGARVNACSIAVRQDLAEWGALTGDERQVLSGDIFIARMEAHERVRENMRSEQCGSARGGACEALVDAEIARLEARAARIGGVLMIVGGGLEIVAGGAAASSCATGLGCIAAAGLATHGADIAGHGVVQLWTGEVTDTFGGGLLQQAGLSPTQAELVYGFMGAGIEIAALRAMLHAPATITPQALATYQRTGVLPEGVAPNRTGSAVDGIYGDIRPMTDEFPELAGVNPHYVDGAGPSENTNCVSCVNATVDRLTGRNPDAVAGPSNGYGVPNDLNPSAPWGFRQPTSPANVTNELLSQGDGAISVVRIQQSGTDIEHVIVGVNRGGTVHYIDPQLGAIVDLQPNLTVIPGYN